MPPTDPAEVTAIQLDLHDVGLGAVVGDADGDYGPQTEEAVRRFQEAWTGGPLAVDGDCGPATRPVLRGCAAVGGAISPHFRLREFQSPDTGDVRCLRELVLGLEALRALRGDPLRVVSGYRTADHNEAVGGASRSQHLVGTAADVPGAHALDVVRGLQVFSGIGYVESTGTVLHVDVRHAGEWPDGGSPLEPTLWTY